MTLRLLLQTSLLFSGLFVVGTAICLPLFDWHFKTLTASKLWIKIVWWVPIFVVFEACLWIGPVACAFVGITLLAQAMREFLRQRPVLTALAYVYFVCFTLAIVHLPLYFYHLPATAVDALTAVCLASVLSDVCAFFLGSFWGKHSLPAWINTHKSFEGVVGQILGSYAGFWLVYVLLGIHLSWWLPLVVGVASAFGDLLNSTVKRQLDIKDWGQTIPGHGGVLDRFSSLSFALAAGFWLLYIT